MIQSNGNIGLVMADDHAIFRDGFRLITSSDAKITLLAQASNGKELLEMVEKFQPDVVITDIKMPELDGIAATQAIVDRWPWIKVIALTMFDEDDLIMEMLDAGVSGYLLKNANKEEVLEAIHTVSGGDPYYCHTTSSKLMRLIAKNKYHALKRHEKAEFTEKEIEIIQLICSEFTNKEIGEKLFLSVRTVEGIRLKILEKMRVKNTVGLVIYAIQNGIYTIK
jgi:DNA-binding NarL/FixJ family response regulator